MRMRLKSLTELQSNPALWQYPDGPWGWNDDGTSKAPTAEEREAHVDWYHDYREMHNVDNVMGYDD